MIIWITGLPGSGKTTIGREIFSLVKAQRVNTVFLDGDSFRAMFSPDLGYTISDRKRNITRVQNMCKYLDDQGINVVCAVASIFKEVHFENRELFSEYYQVYIKVPFKELLKRDQKGLYSAASNRRIENVVGFDIPFDEPLDSDVIIENKEPFNEPSALAKAIVRSAWNDKISIY